MKRLTLLLASCALIPLVYAQTPAPSAPASTAVQTSTVVQPATTVTTTTASNAVDFSGNYKCTGYDPYNKQNYSYPRVSIVKNDAVYNIQWQDDSGNPMMLGTGVTHPNVAGTLAVVYSSTKKDFFNLGIYKLNTDGTLQSNWVSNGSKLIGTETCTKI